MFALPSGTVTVTTAHGHDLMLRNLQRISGFAVWNSHVMMRW